MGHRRTLEDVMLASGWDVKALASSAANVESGNTNALGKGKSYARLKVPGGAYMYPAYDLNHSYQDTDVYVSMAKLKNHATCGVTLSLKNCFGRFPHPSTATTPAWTSPMKTHLRPRPRGA